jgi:sugar (pentulose or hexulose) kinase
VAEAGQPAGVLTKAGARLLDPSGALQPGIRFCPPEGDGGTGMISTNSVAPRSGNVSAGTSVFATIVLEKALEHPHPEIDLLCTPAGDPAAMVHANNGTSEIDAWAQVFAQFAARAGFPLDEAAVYPTLFTAALDGEADAGGLLAYNFLAGEHLIGLEEGRPLLVRPPESRLTLPNLMRAWLLSGFAVLSLGMRILAAEGVGVDVMFAHGGIFATKGVAQRLLAAALDTPVSVGQTASEGGAWGMAVLAAYAADSAGLPLPQFLSQVVFADAEIDTVAPDPLDVAGHQQFMARYEAGLDIERAAVSAS